jgi:hypothetical protein
MIRSQQYESLQFTNYTIQRFIDEEGERPVDSIEEISYTGR